MKVKNQKKIKEPGDGYASKLEKYDRKQNKKQMKSMKTAGVATALKKAQKKPKALPKLKAQKKGK